MKVVFFFSFACVWKKKLHRANVDADYMKKLNDVRHGICSIALDYSLP